MRKKGDWKVQKGLLRVPWFGRHVEKLGDVIIYPVLVVPRTACVQSYFASSKKPTLPYARRLRVNSYARVLLTPEIQR